LDDLDQFFDHMARFEVADAPASIEEIVQAIQIPTHSPLIGRPVKGGTSKAAALAKRRYILSQEPE
ncbi:MAG TPA: hypothetical protein VND19_15005, partial [Acetobacteraceae bacterium]|nr:hypothetical protein [Acetobacteraceae bacterium]